MKLVLCLKFWNGLWAAFILFSMMVLLVKGISVTLRWWFLQSGIVLYKNKSLPKNFSPFSFPEERRGKFSLTQRGFAHAETYPVQPAVDFVSSCVCACSFAADNFRREGERREGRRGKKNTTHVHQSGEGGTVVRKRCGWAPGDAQCVTLGPQSIPFHGWSGMCTWR